jgi:uncharacterized membrane protein YvbJ
MIHYCKECGTRLEGEYAFCPECGTAVDKVQSAPADPSANVVTAKKGFVLTTAAKIIIGSTLALALLLVGGYFLGKYFTDEDRLIQRFEKAVESGNSEKLFTLLSASNEDLKLDRKTADGMIAYFKANSDSLQDLKEQLKAQAVELKKDALATSVSGEGSFIHLEKKDKKRWLIYDDYELKLQRYMVPVQTNYEGAKIYIDGKEAATADDSESSIEVGPLLPGEYEIKAEFQGEFTTLENKQKVSLFPMSAYDDVVELLLEGDSVTVYADDPSSRIFINGKDIGLTVQDGQEIGPIAVDGSNSMYVQAEFPWGTMKSETLPVDNDVLEFSVTGLDEATKDAVMKAAKDFVESWIESFAAMDASKLRHAQQDRAADLVEYIKEMQQNNQAYTGSLTQMVYDLDSFSLNPLSDGGYSVKVKAQVDYSEATYYLTDAAQPEPVAGTNHTTYELIYKDGDWVVSNWEQSSDNGATNTKVYQ